MNIAKQIIDQRITGIVADNPFVFDDLADLERKRSRAFLLLGVAAYLGIDMAEAVQYITDGANDGGFDAAYIAQQGEGRLGVALFQSKYVRDLEKDSNFPANAIEKAVSTIQSVFDPAKELQLNEKSRQKVEEIRSYKEHVPYVTFVMLNNGLSWNQDGQSHIDNAYKGNGQVEFVHFNHNDIIKHMHQPPSIDTKIQFKGKAIQEDFDYKRVMLGKVSVNEIHRLIEEFGDGLLEKNIRKFLGLNPVNKQICDT
ncbi:MAG: hypothetical protein LBV04_04555, partial [Deferribacteraceae bacterium]|nr:hypothetical protein [Deferribacteraceae bacterium]